MSGIGGEPYHPTSKERNNMPCTAEGCNGHLVFNANINKAPVVGLYTCNSCHKHYYIVEE